MRPHTSPPSIWTGLTATLVMLIVTALCLDAQPLNVFVSISPQHEFVSRIGGDRVNVTVLVGSGQSPATYSVTPRQMAMLSRADVLLTIGVPFENTLVPKIQRSIPGLRVVDTAMGIKRRKMASHVHSGESEEHDEHAEDHDRPGEHAEEGHDDHHHHDGDDPHTWLSPLLVIEQCHVIADALANLDPEGRTVYEANLKNYEKDLRAVDLRLKETLAPVRGKALMVFHPAFGYLADAYGLKQVPIEVEGKSPSARDLGILIQKARQQNVRVIFVQKQFSGKAAAAIAESIGGAVVPIDPLASEYIANLEDMADAIRKGLDTQR